MSVRSGALLVLGVLTSGLLSAPIQECSVGVMFVADDADLCRYHWCTGGDGPVQMLCAPGARVPTWFTTAPSDNEIPCVIDHRQDLTCLRCDFSEDPRLVVDRDDCVNNPCPSGCLCQDLWQESFCLCPGNTVPLVPFIGDDNAIITRFCDTRPCQNGATCHSQYDDYWCECPRGYTGKNCETPFCDPNPCFNGGVCTLDEVNYHCECSQCFDGPCCETPLQQCRSAFNPANQQPRPVTSPVVIRTQRPTTPYSPPVVSARPPPPPPISSTTSSTTTSASPLVCGACQWGPNCEQNRDWLCSCNPCSFNYQICYNSPEPITFTSVAHPRECLGKPGPYGSQYTLTFSQDAKAGAGFKRVYVSVGGDGLSESRRVRIYTPNLNRNDPCYVDTFVTATRESPAYYDVPADCLNTETGDIESNKVLRVSQTEQREIAVTVSNQDGDGYLAIPDSSAGQHYVMHSYSGSGSVQWFTVLALTDNTEVTIRMPDGAVETYTLNALQSLRYSSSFANLAGTEIISNGGSIHVWSGNSDANSQKSQEQLLSVQQWGLPNGNGGYSYVIVGISDSTMDAGDLVNFETALPTTYTLVRITSGGQRVQETTGRSVPAKSAISLGSLGAGEQFVLTTNQPVQVTHNIQGRSIGAGGDNRQYHSAYAIIPSEGSYAGSYSFQTHGSRGGIGSSFNRHYVTLVSPREAPTAQIPDFFWKIRIYYYNPATGRTTTYYPDQLGAQWIRVNDQYYGARITLPGEGYYYFSNPSFSQFSFQAIYYALNFNQQGSVQPNTAFPLGFSNLNFPNRVPKPVICPSCRRGPNCEFRILNRCDECNPCPNFDDKCTPGASENQPRTCMSGQDNTGNPFTLMFMQNRPDNTQKRELEIYVTPAGVGSQTVRVFTPYLPFTDQCYLDETREITGFTVQVFNIQNQECYETIGSGTFNNKAIRVQSQSTDGDLLVYAINRDEFSADGWIALPDEQAGKDFYTVSYAPPTYGTEFAVVNIQNEPVSITLTYTGRATADIPGTKFTLQPGEVLQIQALGNNQDLSGTRIQSSKPVNAYSGNIRAKVSQVQDGPDINTGSRDHLVEQLIPVDRWGSIFNIQPIPGRTFGDQIKIVGSQSSTSCRLSQRNSDTAQITDITFRVNAGGTFTRDILSGNTYRLVCSQRVLLAQITKSQERGRNMHDPSLITIPPVEQYANRYIFNTPSFSGGTGDKRPYEHRLVLISARAQDRDGIVVRHVNGDRRLSDLGEWQQVPNSDYYNIVGELEVGTSLILHDSDDLSSDFMCIFYGYDDRESLGFPMGMKLQIIGDDALQVNSLDNTI